MELVISNKSYHDPRTESGAISSHDDASNDPAIAV